MLKFYDTVELYCQKDINRKFGVECYNCFPVNYYSKSKNAAINWAAFHQNITPYIKKTNNEFKGLTIVDLESRENGGRAYKIIIEKDNEKFLIDMRESTMTDIIMNIGIQAGGYVDSDFCFISDGAQTRIIRIGSPEYNEAIKNIDNGKASEKIKNLVIGEIYQNKKDDRFLYLGEYYFPQIDNNKITKFSKEKLFLNCKEYLYFSYRKLSEAFLKYGTFKNPECEITYIIFERKNNPTFYTILDSLDINTDKIIEDIKRESLLQIENIFKKIPKNTRHHYTDNYKNECISYFLLSSIVKENNPDINYDLFNKIINIK